MRPELYNFIGQNGSQILSEKFLGMAGYDKHPLYTELEHRRRLRKGFYYNLWSIAKEAAVYSTNMRVTANYGSLRGFKREVFTEHLPEIVGDIMETVAEELKMVNEEVEKSKEVLGEVFNAIRATFDIVSAGLREEITKLRTSRTTAVSEVAQITSSLREVRKFFLDHEYKEEMKRLGEFVELCGQLKKFKEDGTLDAVTDTIIALSLKEGRKC